MNPFIQKVLVITALIIAVYFLISNYFLPKKKTNDKNCGNGSCGC